MSIMTSISLQKADGVELQHRYRGKCVRWTGCILYVVFVMISCLLLFNYPSTPMIALFAIVHVCLIMAFYLLFPTVFASSSQADLVYDGQRLAWRPSFSVPNEANPKDPIRPTNEFMSYSFI